MHIKLERKYYHLFVEKCHPLENDKVLDVGVTPIISSVGAKRITNNFFEKMYPYKHNITATSIEDASYLEEEYKGLRFVQTDAYNVPFCNREFAALFCNAVVEHTGSIDEQKKFVHEYVRVSETFMFTTPNRWFPIEMHLMVPFSHWFPAGIFRKILKIFGMKELSKESNLNLLSAKEFMKLKGNPYWK